MSTERAGFRGDINGLRAWAVVFVVLYHFGIPGFGGGFVGVDIFFVISGFLMTGIAIRGLERGSFSVLQFYLARAKRIVPALAALCAVLLVLGYLVLLPPDYKALATQSVYSLAFLSNVEFWRTAGYFDVASHEKWLLHTWSLSVEWQFYLVLPLVLPLVWRLRPGRTAQAVALGVLFAASLAASVHAVGTDPSGAFYLLHARAWEMIAGGLVFLAAPQLTMTAGTRRAVEAVGLAMLVSSLWLFDQHARWPGWNALLPVAGAALVLAVQRESTWTGNRVAQWLGDRSYSIYLWHWPVFVALMFTEQQRYAWALGAGLVLTLLLGHLSYQWVENTSRKALAAVRAPRAAVLLAALALAIVTPGVAVWAGKGVAGRFAPAVEMAAAEAANANPRKRECHSDSGAVSPSCVYGGGAAWNAILVGDSHGDALMTAVGQASGGGGVVQWTYSGCPFVGGLKKTPGELAKLGSKYRCSEFIEWAETRLKTLPPEIPLVIVSRYAVSTFGPNEEHRPDRAPTVYFSQVHERANPAFLREYGARITASACALARRRTVYLMRPLPEIGINVPKFLPRRLTVGRSGEITLPLAEYRARNDWVWQAQDAARAQCGVRILDPLPFLCKDGLCYGSQAGRPLYYDDNHISEFGNKLLVPMFQQVFADARLLAAPTTPRQNH